MINLIIFLFSITLNFNDCKEEFINKVVGNFSGNSYFIVAKMKFKDGGVYKYAIERNFFVKVISKEYDHISYKTFTDTIKSKLLKDRVFQITDSSSISFFKANSMLVTGNDPKLDSLFSLGREKFINYFFDGVELKVEGVDYALLIDKLFKLGIPIFFHSRFYIDKRFVCN